MKRTSIALLTLLLVSAGGIALAGAGKGARFDRADRDSNGVITLDEMEKSRLERFNKADADGSGAVTRAELEAVTKGRVARNLDRMWNRLDTNGDGEISSAESEEHGTRRFAGMDVDGDGGITREEAEAHHKNRREKRGQAN